MCVCVIQLTACVKVLTFPFTKKQVESSLAQQALQPRIKEIKRVFADDKAKVQAETSRLFEEAGVNPTAGCLPLLITWPIFIGLYRCFTNAADEGLFDEPFLWLPSLSGPTSVASRSAGLGLAWLAPLGDDGAPPIGWHNALLYLSVPALLIASQYASQALVSTQNDESRSSDDDESQEFAQTLVKVLPLMVGYFALNVPSGLGLYWLTNNALTTAQQVWLRRFGGANVNVVLPDQKLKYGTAIRSGLRPDPEAMGIIAAFADSVNNVVGGADTATAAAGAAGDTSNAPMTIASPLDMQLTRRAKRFRDGRAMQVYTSSQEEDVEEGMNTTNQRLPQEKKASDQDETHASHSQL